MGSDRLYGGGGNSEARYNGTDRAVEIDLDGGGTLDLVMVTPLVGSADQLTASDFLFLA